MRGWLARRWYDVVFWSSFYGFTFGSSLRVKGRRNVPKTGPLLLMSNHQSHFDPVLIGLASRRYLSYLARRSLFRNRYFRGLIESLNAIPIDQEGLAKRGLQDVLAALDRGLAVTIFPEGHRTFDGNLQPLMPGIALLIKRAKVPVVPVGIAGAYHAWPRQRAYPLPSPLICPATPRTIAVVIGKPIAPSRFEGLAREETLEFLSAEMARMFDEAEALRRKR